MTSWTTPQLDVPLLRKSLEYITAHREQWKQGLWLQRGACGTVGCLAGNVALNAGYLPVFARRGLITDFVSREPLTPEQRRLWDRGDSVDADVLYVSEAAQRELGLTKRQADDLFSAVNTLYDLWATASAISGGEIEIPPEVVEEHEDHAGGRVPNGYDFIARTHPEPGMRRAQHVWMSRDEA